MATKESRAETSKENQSSVDNRSQLSHIYHHEQQWVVHTAQLNCSDAKLALLGL
jgi:hypothetical protein